MRQDRVEVQAGYGRHVVGDTQARAVARHVGGTQAVDAVDARALAFGIEQHGTGRPRQRAEAAFERTFDAAVACAAVAHPRAGVRITALADVGRLRTVDVEE